MECSSFCILEIYQIFKNNKGLCWKNKSQLHKGFRKLDYLLNYHLSLIVLNLFDSRMKFIKR